MKTELEKCQEFCLEIKNALSRKISVKIKSPSNNIINVIDCQVVDINQVGINFTKNDKPEARPFVEVIASDNKKHGYWANSFHHVQIEY